MKKRFMSLLLALIMVFSVLPSGMVAAAQEQTETVSEVICIDFQDSLSRAAEQDFWAALPAVTTKSGADAVRVGLLYPKKDPEEVIAAYANMNTWLLENEGWAINEEASQLTNGSGNKIYFSYDEDLDWGLGHNPYFMNFTDGRSDMVIDVDVAQAGWYNLTFGVSMAATNSTDYCVDTISGGSSDGGGSYADIIVGDETIYAHLSSVGANAKVERSVGAVYLEEGINAITLRTVANVWNSVSSTLRSNFNLYNLVLTSLNTVSIEQGKKQVVNLNNTYLAFDAEVSADTHTAVSTDAGIATASINEGGSVVIKGVKMGETEVKVFEGETLLCTIPVEITERVSPVFVPQTIKMDFMQFAAKAQAQSWWTGLEETNVDGIRHFGSGGWSDDMTDDQKAAYNEMQKWLQENTCWSFDNAGGYTNTSNLKRVFINTNSNFDYGLRFYGAMIGYGDTRGQLAFTVNVPEEGEGLYNLTIDMLNESTGDADIYKVNNTEGCGQGNIMVNGKVVYENYKFNAPKTAREVLSFGTVYLTEGANSVVIDVTGDYFGKNTNARRSVNLRAIELEPLFGQTVEEGAKDIVDLRTTYLAFDETVSEALAVISSDEDILTASIDVNGNVVVVGKAAGGASVTVTDGDTKICTMDYEVVAKSSLIYDFTKASALTADGFNKAASYEDLDVNDGICSDLWAFDSVSSRTVSRYSAAEEAAQFTGEAGNRLSFKLQVTADGWHSPELRLYKNALGGDVAVYLMGEYGEQYLGTVNTYAANKTLDVQTLRSVELAQGEYILSFELLGSNTFLWSDLTMKKAEKPTLAITAGNLSQKQGRLMETTLSAAWDDGRLDDLYLADFVVEVSDTDGIDAKVVPGTLTAAPTLQATGLKPGTYEITVTAIVNGVEASTTIKAEVLAHVALESFDVNIACIDKGILVRNTTREFDYDMVGVDGDVIYPDEIDVTYTVSDPSVAVVDAENHTLRAIANGDVSVTVTASSSGESFSKTLTYTVADVGENRIDDASSYFTDGTGGYLMNSATKPGTENAICWTDIADDGTGNMAIRVVANPEVTNREAKGGGELVLANGHLAEIKGGQLYEMSFKMKAEGYVKPEDAKSNWRFIFQLYDYMENARSSMIVKEYSSSVYGKPEELSADEWTTYTVRVRAPIDTDEVMYLTPRITYGPFVGYYPTDQDVKGWEGTFWIDDIEIREVAFDHVDMELQGPLNAIGRKVAVKVTPVTSTGNPIIFDDEAFPTMFNVRSTNEDVIAIHPEVTPLYVGDYFHNDDYPTVNVELVGLNAAAQAIAEVQINDEVREGVLDVNVTDMPDQLRDISFTLNGVESLVLKKGDTADAALSARSTQLVQYTEEDIRSMGSVYFTSSNTKVATVDTVTGEVTCTGEGTAIITGYVNLGSEIKTDTVILTVTDDTDLASISIDAPVTYVGISNKLQFAVEGLKASGGAANMEKYPVAWSVDDETVAAIDDNGKLTGLAEGIVTVTATIGVQRSVISDSMEVRVIANEELSGDNIFYEFIYGNAVGFENFTVDKNGWAINWDETYNSGVGMKSTTAGLDMKVPVGQSMVLDFMVHKDGWYQVQIRGASRSYDGATTNAFVDDAYVGDMIFQGSGGHYGVRGGGNTVWLTAGTHSLKLTSLNKDKTVIYLGGLRLYAVSDPNEVQLDMTASKTDLVIGQTADAQLELTPANGKSFSLLQQEELGDYTNCYTLISSDENVVSVSGMTLIAKAAGTAIVTLNGEIDHKPVSASVEIAVKDAVIASAELTAEDTAFKPGTEAQQLTLTVFGAGGTALTELPEGVTVSYTTSDAAVADVDANGLVTIGQVGAAKITATVAEEGHTVEAVLWITVTEGKTAPTLYTYEERANAQENVLKYTWAWSEKEAAVKKADLFVEKLDYIYSEMFFPQTWPGNTSSTGYQSDSEGKICRYCKVDLTARWGHHPWITDPVNNPWKITCPNCKRDFPSNDFGAYYRSGIGEDGLFHEELADKTLLTNDLYPEMGEGWGVDDGWGYKAGTYDADGSVQDYLFISCYIRAMHGASGENTLNVVLNSLRDAYLYTGDEKYGNAGAILVDRLADIYPTYNLSVYEIMKYHDSDGNGGRGRMVGCIWDAIYAQTYARAFDAFWDCMDNDEVVNYLRQYASWKGLTSEEITPEQIRDNCEVNLILELYEAAAMGDLDGNFGMEEAAISCAAVALDREPYTTEMLDWVYNTAKLSGEWSNDTTVMTGGDVGRMLTEEVDRDGLGNEGSTSYNCLWEMYLLDMADALVGVEGYDLWENSQFVNMFTAFMRLTIDGAHTPLMHESSGVYQILGTYANVERMTTAFIATGMKDPEMAKAIYSRNGNKVDGLRGDIFMKDPEAGVRNAVQQLVNEHGEWDHSDSAMMAGFGIAILRDGPAKYIAGTNDADYSTYWMYYGYTNSAHHQKEMLNFDLTAFGISLSGNMGYPLLVNSNPERYQWVQNTISNNTVVVNRKGQLQVEYGGFPLHFADGGKAKVMDAEAAHVYEETDIYRRTMVTVDNGDGINYAVDFFRVLGGDEHVYSFHAASITDPVVEGLDMTVQPMGTYLSPDVPFGTEPSGNGDEDAAYVMSGYSWLYNVSRDEAPSSSFTIDWKIEDFYNHLPTTAGTRLKLHMVSEEPVSDVALADGNPPQDGRNPKHLEFALIRNQGIEGMDSLFTAVYEPYQITSYIEKTELADVQLVAGTEKVTDKAVAMKVTLKNGRVDYIVYATNPDCTYKVDDKLTFKGFAGVVSYEGEVLTYAWGDEVSLIEDSKLGTVIENDAAIEGTVVSFTEGLGSSYTMTIETDRQVTEDEILGKYIYVNNDGVDNAAYRIHGAKIDGTAVVIDLRTQTLVREYVDEWNFDKGFVHNIAVGNTFTIPMDASFDVGDLFVYTTDKVVKAGTKFSVTAGVAGAGVTYEIEGLPTGAKFTASNATITWTTSKTQVGRYPVTVKAVNTDGDVLGTMSFVIYVVSYTGTAYDASSCTHAKAVTYTVDGIVETVCPACGTVTKTEVTDKFDLAGSNMTLGSDLKMNYLVKSSNLGNETYTAKITHNGEVTEATFAKYNSTYHYVSYTVAAAQMADVITVEVFDEAGNAVSNVYTTSVRTYAMNLLGRTTTNAKTKTLLVDMLNYGAAAQENFKYNTSDLANANLTAAQQALATASVTCTDGRVKGENYYGSSLSLEGKILLNVYFKNVASGMYAEISFTAFDGSKQTIEVPFAEFKKLSGSTYAVVVDDIVLAESFNLVTVTVYNADGTIHGTATDSVESYIARSAASDLNEAIMKFAASAKAYYS